jgi:hypothetical protein
LIEPKGEETSGINAISRDRAANPTTVKGQEWPGNCGKMQKKCGEESVQAIARA